MEGLDASQLEGALAAARPVTEQQVQIALSAVVWNVTQGQSFMLNVHKAWTCHVHVIVRCPTQCLAKH